MVKIHSAVSFSNARDPECIYFLRNCRLILTRDSANQEINGETNGNVILCTDSTITEINDFQ